MASALLAILTTVRLIANPWLWEYHSRSGIVVFNWYLYTLVCPRSRSSPRRTWCAAMHGPSRYHYAPPWFVARVLLFVLLNVEIADAYSTAKRSAFHMGASSART